IRDTEELLAEARSESSANAALKKSLLDMVGLKLPMSDGDVIELLRYVLTASAKFYSSRVSLTDTVNALSEIREEMLLDDDASPKQIVTAVRQYLSLNNHLLDVIDEVSAQRLAPRAQKPDSHKVDLENCSPEEALAERVRMIRELGDFAEAGARFREMFDSALNAVKENAVEKLSQKFSEELCPEALAEFLSAGKPNEGEPVDVSSDTVLGTQPLGMGAQPSEVKPNDED
ncbi:MAG: hypothetical protein V3V10_10045, partial [Planctomycetota bacterium]